VLWFIDALIEIAKRLIIRVKKGSEPNGAYFKELTPKNRMNAVKRINRERCASFVGILYM
jgi:hypothetical protein